MINRYYDDNPYNEYHGAKAMWDAMTDGVYGDMPEGFNGDYSFMGH